MSRKFTRYVALSTVVGLPPFPFGGTYASQIKVSGGTSLCRLLHREVRQRVSLQVPLSAHRPWGASGLRSSLLLAEEPQDPVVDLRRLLNQHEVANPLDPLDLGARPEESRHPLRCLRIEGNTTVLGAV